MLLSCHGLGILKLKLLIIGCRRIGECEDERETMRVASLAVDQAAESQTDDVPVEVERLSIPVSENSNGKTMVESGAKASCMVGHSRQAKFELRPNRLRGYSAHRVVSC